MQLTPQIQKAINVATKLHHGQERKTSTTPYIVHPYSVGIILMQYTEDENIVIAGILHDTIEDTGYTKEQLEKDFGKRVAELVLDVTEDKKLPWQEQKDGYINHIRISGHDSKLVCAADKLHNLQTMRRAFNKKGNNAFTKFHGQGENKLWLYEECLKIFNNDNQMPPALIKDIEDTIQDIKDEEKLRSNLFIGILSETINNHWDNSKIFLVNPTNSTFTIKQIQGAFDGSDDELFDLGSGEVGTYELTPNSFHQIDEMKDGGELDFTTWYNFILKEKETGKTGKLNGSVNGHIILYGTERIIPIINQKGITKELWI